MGTDQSKKLNELRSALEREESRVQAMLEVGRALTAVHSLDELLRLIVDRVSHLMEADRSTIFLVDRDTDEIWSKVAQGDNLTEIRLPMSEGIAGWVATNGKTLNLKDAYADERFNQKVDKATGYRTGTILSVPLRSKQGEILGVIQSLNKRGGHFTTEDEKLLEAISSQVAIAIENTKLMIRVVGKNIELVEAQAKLARKVEELDVLFNLEKEISTSLQEDELLHRLLRRAVDLVGCEAGSVVLLSEESEELIFTAAVGTRADEVQRLRLPRGAGIAGWVAEQGRTALVNDPATDQRHMKDLERELDFPVRNILAVPMIMGGEPVGAVELLNKRSGIFEHDDEMLATIIAGQAVSAIQVGQLRQQRDRENRLSSIGHMLSGVIHDFRTPMTIISGYVQLMAMEDNENTRKDQSEIVLKQFDFINNMTSELLAFARGESSLLLHKVYTDRFLREMEEVLTKELDQNRIKLKVEDLYDGPLRADENKLRRMVFNITRNARQAMPDGGEFTIRLEDAGERVRFSFTDTGPGIPQDIRDRLFEYFVTSGKEDGTGLGLAVVKKIVDEHEGVIEVSSPDTGGARFSIEIPKRIEA